MSGPLILGVMVVYAIIAVDQFAKGESAMGVVWLGYSLSNAGLFYAAK